MSRPGVRAAEVSGGLSSDGGRGETEGPAHPRTSDLCQDVSSTTKCTKDGGGHQTFTEHLAHAGHQRTLPSSIYSYSSMIETVTVPCDGRTRDPTDGHALILSTCEYDAVSSRSVFAEEVTVRDLEMGVLPDHPGAHLTTRPLPGGREPGRWQSDKDMTCCAGFEAEEEGHEPQDQSTPRSRKGQGNSPADTRRPVGLLTHGATGNKPTWRQVTTSGVLRDSSQGTAPLYGQIRTGRHKGGTPPLKSGRARAEPFLRKQ